MEQEIRDFLLGLAIGVFVIPVVLLGALILAVRLGL